MQHPLLSPVPSQHLTPLLSYIHIIRYLTIPDSHPRISCHSQSIDCHKHRLKENVDVVADKIRMSVCMEEIIYGETDYLTIPDSHPRISCHSQSIDCHKHVPHIYKQDPPRESYPHLSHDRAWGNAKGRGSYRFNAYWDGIPEKLSPTSTGSHNK